MRRTLKKIAKYGSLTLVVLVCGAAAWLFGMNPKSRPAPEIKIERTAERIARGKYVFQLADCDNCHSQHDVSPTQYKLIESGRGRGQFFPMGDGKGIRIPNITPDPETGLGRWTDGEILRAVREGVSRDGRALVPFMPYNNFRHMSDEDAYALVAYLRTLPAIKHEMPASTLPPHMKALVRMAPRPLDGPVKSPNRSNRRLYGEYLTTIGGCEGCHTAQGGGAKFAGGHTFDIPGGARVVSANLTPDSSTGIGSWTLDYFLARFHRYRDGVPSDAQNRFTLMPWTNLAKLTDDDLTIIYEYLRQQTPVENKVNRFPQQQIAKR